MPSRYGQCSCEAFFFRTFQFAAHSISPGQGYSNSCTLPAGQCGLRKRQTGKATCSAAIGWTQACSVLASSVGQQPARPDRVASLRFGLPFRLYANISVCRLNSIPVVSRGLRLRANFPVSCKCGLRLFGPGRLGSMCGLVLFLSSARNHYRVLSF